MARTFDFYERYGVEAYCLYAPHHEMTRERDQARERVAREQEQAERERQQAEQEHKRAERLAQKLRALGIDPETPTPLP